MNILLTSVGRRAYIIDYLRDVYKKLGLVGNIIATNSDMNTTAMSVADKAFESPIIYDEKYIPFLLEICKSEKIDMLISLFDIDLMILAKNKSRFEEMGVKVIVSNEDIINICNDKFEMLKYLKKINMPVPKTYIDLEEALKGADFDKNSYILKPRWGMGSLSIFEAENKKELEVLYEKAKRSIQKSYLRFESGADIDRAILIQEKIKGDEYGLDIFNDFKGENLTVTVKRKLAMRSGETDIAKVIENRELEDIGKKIAESLKHIGNLDMDILFDGRKAYIIDMNARFGGGYPFTHSAGVNELEALIRLCKNEKVNDLSVKKYGLFAKEIAMLELK
ncbi:ATP-grasp domain-containing protein [Lachnoanaerobaculum sp. Marseille-Q4761]|uniref:ATP-grasp domain-containing protein n=1 Tax=Lachnoanaerobaculum sp. Marseille-Q4761 TaxID=2819511 RepID=UPI001AA16E26|nr:ATP-grasp domain-containing protein [Lachnoanaerobaculum sp. Marseille-Q4761]MBO1869764.1 ATP-grasp domain-containing protein [Lachnoanaerobaculum sp. Marseille-Q4761]